MEGSLFTIKSHNECSQQQFYFNNKLCKGGNMFYDTLNMYMFYTALIY